MANSALQKFRPGSSILPSSSFRPEPGKQAAELHIDTQKRLPTLALFPNGSPSGYRGPTGDLFLYVGPLFRCASISWIHVRDSQINVFEILSNLGHSPDILQTFCRHSADVDSNSTENSSEFLPRRSSNHSSGARRVILFSRQKLEGRAPEAAADDVSTDGRCTPACNRSVRSWPGKEVIKEWSE